MNKYIGHPSQLGRMEEVILAQGKGKGMNLIQINNAKGIDVTLVCDRAMDISRLSYNGVNLGWFAPVGYAAPGLYDDAKGRGFLNNFTAGFLTTCGLTAVGGPVNDGGENTSMHGMIGNTPCEQYHYYETEEEFVVEALVREASLFSHHTELRRTYRISKTKNQLVLSDTIKNIGRKPAPSMVLYHFNMGYPLLSENAQVVIPENSSFPTNEAFREAYPTRKMMEKPQADYEEKVFVYDVKDVDGKATIGIFNPDSKAGFTMTFSKKTLPYFTEWKMMGEYEYVLGLEPGNSYPVGRDVMRERGELKILQPDESYTTEIVFDFTDKPINLE